MERLLLALVFVFSVTSSAWALGAPFGYGFLGGDSGAPAPNQDAAESTWNDIAHGCHFNSATSLQNAINVIDAGNKIIIHLTYLWRGDPICTFNSPNNWVDASTFNSRVAAYLPTLQNPTNKSRLFAIWLFDEPDSNHGGPTDANLQGAVNYLHQQLPGVPVFVNWFTASNNTRVPNADWYSTTKGASTSSLSGLGKPMFLWWFNNEGNPSASTINARWTSFVDYYFKTNPPPIASLGWCCDSIENYNGSQNNNSTALDALLMHVGQSRRLYGQVSRSGYIQSGSTWRYIKRDPTWNQIRYTDASLFPFFNPFPVSITSNMDPGVALNGSSIHIVSVDTSGQLIRQQWDLGGSFSTWTAAHLNFITNAKPDLFTFGGQTWLAARSTTNSISVRRLGIDTAWTNLGGVATSNPHFKVVSSQLRVAVYRADGNVYSSIWNGSSWSGWAIEP